MKRLATILAFTLLPLLATAQMTFEKGNWASVLAKAKEENKIVFVDFYTTWCGPCKVMAKNIFPLKNVGDFYNANFVNYKIDAEKGEGIALAKKYGVKAYPTYIFTDGNGNFLHQAVGSYKAEDFINHGKTALDPSKQLGNLLKGSGEVSKADMPAYLRKLSQERLPYNDKYEAYISSLSKKELYSQKTYDLMVELGGRDAKGFTYNLIRDNKKKFIKAVGEETISNYFYRKLLTKAYGFSNKKESIQPVLDEAKNIGFDFADKIKATITLTGYNYEGKYNEFLKAAPIYLEKYAKDDLALKFNPVFVEANKFSNYTPEMKKFTLQLAKELIAANYRVMDVNASIGKKYSEAGDFKMALKYYQKGSDYTKANGMEDRLAQSVKFLKEKVAVIEKGDYTFHISGLDKYNGFTFHFFYRSPTDIGEYVETEGVVIKDGSCTITGNVKTPMPAGWSVYEGDNFKGKGSIILEPGEFKAKLKGRDLEVENGWYNYYMHQGLKDNAKYKEATKKMTEFSAKKMDMKNPEVRKEYFKYNDEVLDAQKEYYAGLFNYNADPTVKMLAFYIGNLSREENAEANIQKLQTALGDHYLLKTLAFHKKKNKEREAMQASTAVGKKIKPFVAKDLSGKTFELEKVLKKNNYVMLEFWASWCGPCRGAIPHLKEVYSKYKKEGFEIVSFSLDDKENLWRKASEDEDIPWINTSDLLAYKSPIAKMYGVSGVPYSLIIDKNGVIVYKQLGMSKEFDQKLEELLKK